MAMQKVDLGGERKRFKAVEFPRYGTVVREPLAEKAEKELERFEELTATGVMKRMDITHGKRRDEAAEMLEWLWSQGLSMAQQMIAHGTSNIQLDGSPTVFHKYNLGQGNQWNINPGLAIQDPEIKKFIGKYPIELITPDTFMQWSGDINYPYNFAHFTHGELCLKGIELCMEKGWSYPLPPNNALWALRKGNGRLAGWIGGSGALLPGEQSIDKHKVVHEGGHTCRFIFTPKEEEYLKENGWDEVQYSAGEKVGLDMEQFYEDLVNGKYDDELLKPGIKVDYTAALPYQRTTRRSLAFWRGKKGMGEPDWWKEKNRFDDDGIMIGFGEFEEEEFRERIKKMGYTEVDEEALFKGKVPEGLSREYEAPEALMA